MALNFFQEPIRPNAAPSASSTASLLLSALIAASAIGSSSATAAEPAATAKAPPASTTKAPPATTAKAPPAASSLDSSSTSTSASTCKNKNALGVSRKITIDTHGGRHFGGLQYHDQGLLRDKEVILTFDDGPLRRKTRMVLEALADHCTKGTFFMVGRMAVSDPAMVREVEAAGHTVAHHTWSHKNLKRLGARSAGGEIELGISAVQAAAAKPTSTFFRFPYLSDPATMRNYASSRNLAIFSIDVDSYDYKSKSADRVFGNVMSQLRSRHKGIILFHDIQISTAKALPRVLDTLKREGYKVVQIVSKDAVKTLPDYDEKARGLIDKRRIMVSATAIPGGDYEKAAASSSKSKATNKVASATTAKHTPRSEPAPKVKRVAAPTSNAPSSNAFASSPPRERTDWRSSILGN